MNIAELHARNVADVNARMAAAGRCVFHNSDVNIPARYIVRFPIGNEVPVCVECCAFVRADDTQLEWIKEIGGSSGELRPDH